MMSNYRILTINPGSTSTKIALFQNDEEIFNINITHAAEEMAKYKEINDQMPYRKKMIEDVLKDHNISLDELSAVVGRGGGLIAVEGGVYEINDILLEHAINSENGVKHPAQLGPQLAKEFSNLAGCPAYVVNPPDTDERIPYARMTGIKGVYRNVHLHALNLKETAIRHAKIMGKNYEECNFVVCHIGGGISVSAHEKGRMIDGNDIVGGEGPMAPTRCGAVPAVELIKYCFSGVSEKEAKDLCMKTGGFVSLLGTSDAKEVSERANRGEKVPSIVWNTMIYQITKEIGAMAAALKGKVDGILLGGGMVYNQDLVTKIKEACEFIAPITAYPGEFEMEAMASGAIRVLEGQEKLKEYTGKLVWSKADFED
jgi:butyrate kinase